MTSERVGHGNLKIITFPPPGNMGAVFPTTCVASEVESELSGPSRRPQEKYSGDVTGAVPSLPYTPRMSLYINAPILYINFFH